MLKWLKRLRGTKRTLSLQRIPVRARYDAAQTTDDNSRHWAAADALSAAAANSPSVRRTLRNRARYEAANNSYARGIILTLANDLIGRGPRLQLQTGSPEADRVIERAFSDWAAGIGLAEKLRTMRQAKAVDGEAFAMLTGNERLATGVQLDLRLVEAEQVTEPMLPAAANVASLADGIEFDRWGNPVRYHVLREHPGDALTVPASDVVPASSMIHWFRVDRPGQVRGIPEITPALPLFAQLRRYTLAVIAAAETAADFAAILHTQSPADEADEVEPFLPIEIEQRAMVTMPVGWQMAQLKAEQPSTTYDGFKKEILNEIARCLNMPFNVAAGNSAGYNYASGRLDHQTYYKSIRVEQSECERIVLDRIFAAWLDEAVLVEGLLPRGLPPFAQWSHQWFWDGLEHVDPAKEATAQQTRLANHTTTLAQEYARQGRDWETELRQRAREIELMTELGIPTAAAASASDMSQQIEDAVNDVQEESQTT